MSFNYSKNQYYVNSNQLPAAPVHPVGNFPQVPVGQISGQTKGSNIGDMISLLQKIKNILSPRLDTWRRLSPTCAKLKQAQGPENIKLYSYCTYPNSYIESINWLLNWLNVSLKHYTLQAQMTPSNYLTHMVLGLDVIYNFIILLPILISDAYLYIQDTKNVNLLQKALGTIIVELVGCVDTYVYRFIMEWNAVPGLKAKITPGNYTYNKTLKYKYDRILKVCSDIRNVFNF